MLGETELQAPKVDFFETKPCCGHELVVSVPRLSRFHFNPSVAPTWTLTFVLPGISNGILTVSLWIRMIPIYPGGNISHPAAPAAVGRTCWRPQRQNSVRTREEDRWRSAGREGEEIERE